jgi:23S rRNA (adenine2030-N6)-methyltransferase
MNYRHHFHAGNFADVMKHVLLLQLIRALQRKEKGFLYLDTHAGRGSYDLAVASQGDSLERQPEWPDGIGRLWSTNSEAAPISEYVQQVRQFDRSRGNLTATPRFYPGSPQIARLAARPQDRLVLCEKQSGECAALANEFFAASRVSIHEMDGYAAIRAMLPPVERRALVLIDPPFEAQDEFALVVQSLREGLKRLTSATIAVWYPLTERARIDAFFTDVLAIGLPPTLVFELTLANASAQLRLPGCGMLVVNPPWQFESSVGPAMTELSETLIRGSGAGSRVEWLVPEK